MTQPRTAQRATAPPPDQVRRQDSHPTGPSDRTRINRTFGAIVFDWDGTAVRDRHASARPVRRRIELLSRLGVHTAVVSGTHLDNIDGQLAARPPGPGRLWLALNRGCELYVVTASGPEPVVRRSETARTTRQLDRTAARVCALLRASGLEVDVVSSRLNRRKIDLIPDPAWADPPKARIDELLTAVNARLERAGFASIGQVADLTIRVAAECGVEDARVTSDAKHIEVGITDKSDSMRDVLGELGGQAIGDELILIVGDEFGDLGGLPGSDAHLLVPEAPGAFAVSVGVEPAGVPSTVHHHSGGPAAFRALLDEQLHRARVRRVPSICRDPRWTVAERGVDPSRHRVSESLFTLTSGGIGIRGSVEESPDFGHPLVVAAGVYRGLATGDGLLAGPDLIDLRLTSTVEEDERVLDLHTGVLYREEVSSGGPPLRSLRFGSLVEEGVFALRVEAQTGRLRGQPRSIGRDAWAATSDGPGGIGAMVREETSRDQGVTTIERLIGAHHRASGAADPARAQARLARASAIGFEALLAGQRSAWARRWERVDVRIPDDPVSELALRFALFQLWGLCSTDVDEIAVGARALTGSGYSGHVFWDADVFVLPALMTIDPPSADALVRYRLNRIDAARERAGSEHRDGARFPWESALTGQDVTPTSGSLGGESVAILTGPREEHVTADVAWAVVRNATWSRAGGRLSPAERALMAETARYWASRISTDASGAAHIDAVIGPDEYHENVDDNAFTNVMARWNLRAAARLAGASPADSHEWRRIAGVLVDGFDPNTGLYEQFRGYFDLEPLTVAAFGRPPLAADVLVGRQRIGHSQVIKQPDVLMLHHLVPEQTAVGSLRPNLDFYAPRTAHGSSLSPAVMASLHARAGQLDTALELLRLSLRIDLDDIGGTTSSGVHIGACGGAWQALLFGFLGIRVSAGALLLDPHLPASWPTLQVRFCCLGRHVRVEIDHDVLRVSASAGLTVGIPPSSAFRPVPGDHVRLIRGDAS